MSINTSKSEELLKVQKALALQLEDNGRIAFELIEVNKKLVFQHEENVKLAAQLNVANTEIIYQQEEKEKKSAELILSREIVIRYQEKEKCEEDLQKVNGELIVQIKAKKKVTEELNTAYKELKTAERFLKEYIAGLEEMLFMTTHKIRQPIAHILGISNLLDASIKFPELKILVNYLKQSALTLDDFTIELTGFLVNLEKRAQISNICTSRILHPKDNPAC